MVARKKRSSKGDKGTRGGGGETSLGIDRTKIRLAVFAVLLIAAFVALYSRLWFLQVLAADDYRTQARENRVRRVETEPPRGRILDRNGVVLVDNSFERTVTIDRQVVDDDQAKRTLRWLARPEPRGAGLKLSYKELYENLNDAAASPYKPVPVANNITATQANVIRESANMYPGVDVDYLPMRKYPQGGIAPHILGYVGEIGEDELKDDFFKGSNAGDVIGKAGIERTYDRYLRGTPGLEKVVVDAAGEVVGEPLLTREEEAGSDLILSIDSEIQRLVQKSLKSGIRAARRAAYQAPAGAVVVMDPTNGQVIAMASFPTYSPALLADGFSTKDARKLGVPTETGDDDAQVNRVIAAQRQPGSTFKVVTAGAALANDLISATSQVPCPGRTEYPPEDPFATVFHNWTRADLGLMGVPESLQVSCNTFYYELGWRLETSYGPPKSAGGDGTEEFQRYERLAGFGNPTGIDLPYELGGRVPDEKWCLEAQEETENTQYPLCEQGWLPGYTVNMAIGQGDLIVTPLQMAVTYAAIANGGTVWEPRVAMAVAKDELDDGTVTTSKQKGKAGARTIQGGLQGEDIVTSIEAKPAGELPLDDVELAAIRQGLELVVASPGGTANPAFSGFPLDKFPVAGKTGTAQLGGTKLNDAWFISYGPSNNPKYVIAVYLEKAGHGGESAAPVARQIWEGIAGVDKKTEVSLAEDDSR